MLSKDQDQNVGGGSTAVQAGGNVTLVKVGLAASEVRDIALDVFKANFLDLKGVAADIVKTRGAEITDDFLKRLQRDNPAGLAKANDPGFQYDLFTVQKEYAKTGDKELGDLLVDLLVDRTKRDQRDILQIVLSESLGVAPKLTENQLAALALVFLFKYTQTNVGNLQLFAQLLDSHVAPFASRVVKNLACYQHLEFCGCGSIGMMTLTLEAAIGNAYQGLFLKGFDTQEVENRGISIGLDQRFFIPCLNDPSKIQVSALNSQGLDKTLEAQLIASDDRVKIKALFEFGRMSDAEIKDKCIALRPYMAGLFETWSESAMATFTLTSVGIAIGHANIKRLVGPFADLAIWIN